MISKKQFKLLKFIQHFKCTRNDKNAKYLDYFLEMDFVTYQHGKNDDEPIYKIMPRGENAIANYKYEHFQQNFNTVTSVLAIAISLIALLKDLL